MIHHINFDTTDRNKWLNTIADASEIFVNCTQKDCIELEFNGINGTEKITPIHIVSLACLIEYFDRKSALVRIPKRTNAVSNYLWETLRFREYWAGGQNFVPAQHANVFNLWRIIDDEKEIHSRRIHDYLKQTFFQNKDLSAVQNSLDEVYYNIFDHANADGNAFSFIIYKNEKLYVAVCDFGIGIAKSVRNTLSEIVDDATALRKAMEYKFTTGSRTHNMGMGLGNIKDSCTEDDILGIISNNGCLFAKREHMRAYENDFYFPGTLIYYELSLSHFDEEEIIDNFVL